MITTNENKGKFIFLSLLIFVFIGVFLVAKPAFAIDVLGMAASILGWAIMQVVSILGKILTWVIGLLIEIAQYNGFITSQAVSKGWIIIRDVCNMFFIAALLLIAFGTVLKVEKYSYKRTLGGLLVAAILINFSKFICGFFIDIAQILMLTFVNAFKEAGAGNFLQMLGMDKWLNLSGASAGGASVLTGAVFALILVIISLIVISIMMIILAFRIIMIWLLVVLSPLVFVLNVFPGKMKSYSNMWWEKFTSYLIVGPVMAFFLWLSFAIANESSITVRGSKYSEGGSGGTVVELTENSVSGAANPSNFAKFVVSIAMLVGSLLIAQQLGVAGGKLAGKAVSKMQAYATGQAGILKKVKDRGKLAAKAAGGLGKGLAGMAMTPLKAIPKGIGAGIGAGVGGFIGRIKGKRGYAKAGAKMGAKIGGAIGAPVKSIQGLKNWAGGVLKEGADKREGKIAEGKGSIFDHAFSALSRDFHRFGGSDLNALNVAQTKRVEETKNRLQNQGMSVDGLNNLIKTGTPDEVAAAGVLSAEQGGLSNNPELVNKLRNSVSSNGALAIGLDNHLKKILDPDTLIATIYKGFKKGSAGFKNLMNDIKTGKVDAVKVISNMKENQRKKFLENSEGTAGREILNILSGKQLSDLRGKLTADTLREIFPEKDFNKAYFKGKSEDEKVKYIQATGRVDDLDDSSRFIHDHKALIKNNISTEALEHKTVVEAIIKHLSSKEREAITNVGDNKKVILNTLKESISDYNKEKKVNTKEAKDAREEYVKLNKGGSISNAYYEGTRDDEGKRGEIDEDLTEKVSRGVITMHHVAKLELDVVKNDNDKAMAMAIARGMNAQKLRSLAKLTNLDETIKKICIDWAKSGTPEDKKQAKIVLGDTEYSEHLRTEKKEKSNKNPKE